MTKKCSTCKTQKTLDKFNKNKDTIDGLINICKECVREYNKIYYYSNKEKVKETRKEYYKNNTEKVKKYELINKEKRKEQRKQWVENNREKIRKYAIADSHNRRQKIKETGLKIKTEDICSLFNQQGEICFYCKKTFSKKELTIDHYIPISKGGLHTIENIRIACKYCNSSKHAKMPEEWMLEKDYDKVSNQLISMEVNF